MAKTKEQKKKLARVIATWAVTAVMVSVFLLDIGINAYGNFLSEKYSLTSNNSVNSASDDKIHFLNTLNSDCIIIESNGKFALIDSGEGDENPRKKTYYKGSRQTVIDYIKANCADSEGNICFDFVLATHIHYDHVGNMADIFRESNITAKKLFMKDFSPDFATDMEYNHWGNKETYEEILAVAQSKNIDLIADLPQEEFDFGDFKIKFINTKTPSDLTGRGENVSSVGVLLEINGKKVFLASDFTGENELEKIYAEEIGEIDLLKIGHHGYYGSCSADFLRKTKPQIAIVTNYLGKIYPNVKWNLTVISKTPIYSTAHRNGIIAVFAENEIILKGNTM